MSLANKKATPFVLEKLGTEVNLLEDLFAMICTATVNLFYMSDC